MVAEAIPPELKALDRWVTWRYVEERDPETGKVDWDKPPFNARTGGAASSTNPRTWSPFNVALAAYERGGRDGIGFVLHGEGGLVGVDLDKCRDPATGAIDPWARRVIDALNTYTEVSPSGRGVRLFLRGQLPPHGRKKGHYENYSAGRYVTVTGQHVEGAPLAVEDRQAELLAVHAEFWPERQEAAHAAGPGGQAPTDLDDAEVVRRAGEAKSGPKFRALWVGSTSGYGSHSEADLALVNYLAFWCGPNSEGRIDTLFRQSGLFRSKWQRDDYRERTIRKALEGRTEFYRPGGNGCHRHNGHAGGAGANAGPESSAPGQDDWPCPLPLGTQAPVPAFPVAVLPGWLRAWALAEAEATQTPVDLAAVLALCVAAAALAKKFRVVIRDGWSEPTNLFGAVALLTGERKTAVFAAAVEPVRRHEAELQAEAAPRIAEAASEHRMLEARLKAAETKAAKADVEAERGQLQEEARCVARELAEHQVPDAPQLLCDDVTPEKLANLLARQGGRMLQASAEGTAFEIVKGRYSEGPNFDVYLKGHAGDALRVGRIGREGETVEQPALSAALAVQPDVIRGLAEDNVMRKRGFLGRWLYSLPGSRVGSRRVAPPPVPRAVALDYEHGMLALWRLPGAVGEDGRPAPHFLRFSADADAALQEFERWLEPQLAEGEELSYLAGWANKLAGAAARLAAAFHVGAAVGDGKDWLAPVGEATARAAMMLARDYLLPHARLAFALMGMSSVEDDARHVLRWLRRHCGDCGNSGTGGACVSKRDIYQGCKGTLATVESLEPALELLMRHDYLRPGPPDGKAGPGRKRSPDYLVNPRWLAAPQAPP